MFINQVLLRTKSPHANLKAVVIAAAFLFCLFGGAWIADGKIQHQDQVMQEYTPENLFFDPLTGIKNYEVPSED
jgi:hypothetical protein